MTFGVKLVVVTNKHMGIGSIVIKAYTVGLDNTSSQEPRDNGMVKGGERNMGGKIMEIDNVKI
jgi:hypothetical protein